MKLFSFPRILVIAAVALYFSSSPSAAHAQNLWWTFNCDNCFTGQSFRDAAIQHAKMQIAAGTYLTISGNYSRSAFVKVTGNVVNVCPPTEPCYQELRNVTGTIVDGQGVPISGGSGEGAALENVDQQLFGTYRAAPVAPIKVPEDFGPSLINNQAWYEDANTAIWRVLGQRGITANSNQVKVGTIVTVIWPDGTRAQFKRVGIVGSFQWIYVEGSARNANGQPINPDTGQAASTATSGAGSGGAYTYATAGGSSVVVGSEAGFCLSRQRFYYNGMLYGEWVGVVRCN